MWYNIITVKGVNLTNQKEVDVMKLMYFGKRTWIELDNFEDFDTFYEEIVLEECAFKFIDGTAEEIEKFFLKMEESGGGLDDCDYYRFDCDCVFNEADMIFIFDDLSLFTLDNVIRRHETIMNTYKNIKKRIEEGS